MVYYHHTSKATCEIKEQFPIRQHAPKAQAYLLRIHVSLEANAFRPPAQGRSRSPGYVYTRVKIEGF